MITSDFILMFIMTFVMIVIIANMIFLHIWLNKLSDLLGEFQDCSTDVLADLDCFRIFFEERVRDDIMEVLNNE